MISDYFVLAYKNLKHRGVRSWLTLLGIFIGVTAVVSLISLGNGLEMAVGSQFGISQTELITIQASGAGFGPPGSTSVNSLDLDDLAAVEKVSGVKRSMGRYLRPGKLEYNDKLAFGYITNVPDGENRDFIYDNLDESAVDGRLLKDGDRGKVFLGYNFYVDKVGLDKPITAGKNVLINDKEFEVIGILDKKGSFMFDNAVFMGNSDMDKLLDVGEELDLIIVQPVDVNDMDRLKSDLERALRKSRNVKEGEEDFTVETPEAMMDTVNGVLGGIQAFIIIVASISIFIGAIGIINTMTTSVLERRRDIGIMKSIGARNEDIFMQFFIESSLLGLIGGFVGSVFGILIGVAGTAGIASFLGTDLKPSIDFALIGFTLLGSFLLGGLAGISPAMSAAAQNPVDALRG
ncbi:MAG: ABC transporter permease [Nanoarchaeota archaeon]|jgi:putative ABC transport system permease protein|nr:ABC transporter permease [Nanoarchaeota archaeon]